MIPLIKQIVHSLLWDPDAARRWISMTIGSLGAGGATFADQLASTAGSPKLVTAIRLASFVAVLVSSAWSPKRTA